MRTPPAGPPKPRRPTASIGRKKPRHESPLQQVRKGTVTSGLRISRHETRSKVAHCYRARICAGGCTCFGTSTCAASWIRIRGNAPPPRGPTKTAASNGLDRAKKTADPCTWAGTVTWSRFPHETIKSSAPPRARICAGGCTCFGTSTCAASWIWIRGNATPPARPPKPRRPAGSIGRKKPRTPAAPSWAGTVTWSRFRHETIKSSAPPARGFARGVAHALEQALTPQVGSSFEEMRT